MQKPILSTCFAFLSAVSTSFGQFFSQSFQTSSTVSSYVSNTPDLSQFTHIGANGNHINISIHQGRLRFDKTSSHSHAGAFVRNVDFPGHPETMIMAFDFECSGNGQASNDAFQIAWGNGFSNNEQLENLSNTTARIGFTLINSSGVFRLRNLTQNQTSSNLSGVQRITWVINNSDAAMSYYAPNGALRSIPSKRAELWANTTLIFSNMSLENLNVPLRHFKMVYQPANNNSVFFDNFGIHSRSAEFPFTNVNISPTGDFPSITNTNGFFHFVNNFGALAAPVTCNIAGNLTNETGLFPLAYLQNMETHAVKIQPAGTTARSITSAATVSANGMICFNGAVNAIIDGRAPAEQSNPNAARRLTFTNNPSNGPVIHLRNGASHNRIQHINIEGSSNNSNHACVLIGESPDAPVGNSYNQIVGCHIRSATATPRHGLLVNGSAGKENHHNLIEGNHVYNIYMPGSPSGAIQIGNNIRHLRIDGNHIYQTQSLTPGNQATYISIIGGRAGGSSANADSIFIENNFIGGGAPFCRGNAWSLTTNSTMPLRIRAIDLRLDQGRYALVQNNRINNIHMAFPRTTNTNEYSFRGIYANSGHIDVVSNQIGSNDSLQFSIGTNNTAGLIPIYGIEMSAAIGRVENNRISGFLLNSISSAQGFEFGGIRLFGNTNTTVENNVIGHRTQARIITHSHSTGRNFMYGILSQANGVEGLSIANNTICGLANFSEHVNSLTAGIAHIGSASLNIERDSVFFIQSASASTVLGFNQALCGILLSGAGNVKAEHNIVFNLSNTLATNVANHVSGLSMHGSGTYELSKNRVFALQNASASTAATIAGISTGPIGNGPMLVSNNMISLGWLANGQPYPKDLNFYGIWFSNPGQSMQSSFVYNSVVIGGNQIGNSGTSSPFAMGGLVNTAFTAPLLVANNIFNNTRSHGQRLALSVINAASQLGVINNNIYFSNDASAAFRLGSGILNMNSWQSQSLQDQFSEWHNLTVPSSATSCAGSNNFTNLTQADLHLPECEIRIRSKGRYLGLLTHPVVSDFDGEFRRGTDVGADEVKHTFTFTGGQSTAWHLPQNWDKREVPSCADSVIIAPIGHVVNTPSGNVSVQRQPIVQDNDTASYMSLRVLAGATLSMSGNFKTQGCWRDGVTQIDGQLQLTDNGHWLMSGDFTLNGSMQAGSSYTTLNTDSTKYLPARNVDLNALMYQINSVSDSIYILGTGAVQMSSVVLPPHTKVIQANTHASGIWFHHTGSLMFRHSSEWIMDGKSVRINGTIDTMSVGTFKGDALARMTVAGDGPLLGALKFSTGHQHLSALKLNRVNLQPEAVLGSPLLVKDTIGIAHGILFTSAQNLLEVESAARWIGLGGTSNYIDGPVKLWTQSNEARRIPLGRKGRFRPLHIQPKTNHVQAFTVEYFDINPQTAGYPLNQKSHELESIKDKEYWIIERHGSHHPVDYQFHWGPESDISQQGIDIMKLRMANWDAVTQQWENMGPDDHSSSGNSQQGFTPVYSATVGGPFTFGMIFIDPLPITLISFTAEKHQNDVLLQWTTASEVNNDYFSLERSFDAKQFNSIGRVEGAGNSNQIRKYDFIDVNAALLGAPILYYRLTQFDFNGDNASSEIVPIMLQGKAELQIVHASLGQGNGLQLVFNAGAEEIQITCYDMSGRNVFHKRLQATGGLHHLDEPLQMPLAKGIYTLSLETESSRASLLLVKH